MRPAGRTQKSRASEEFSEALVRPIKRGLTLKIGSKKSGVKLIEGPRETAHGTMSAEISSRQAVGAKKSLILNL